MDLPSGRVTLVFTDIEGSTTLWEKLGDSFRADLELHNEVLRAQIAAWRGCEVKTEGDAFMVAFARASDAVNFAVSAQEMLSSTRWPHGTDLVRVRMGLHTGEPIFVTDPVSGRVDYLGPVVNRAARISSAGHGGQILLSDVTRADAENVAERAVLKDMGEHRLRGLERPEHIWQLHSSMQSGAEFPPLKTLEASPTNLPYQPTSFIGRERELTEISATLTRDDVRLLTITGPGGTGKTRFALRLANDLLDAFEGGCWLADLSEARDATGIFKSVMDAFGARLVPDARPEQAVSDLLSYRKPLLLVVDNFEQVVACAAQTMDVWRRKAPQVKFLVTSRVVLGLAGERVFELGPLGAPPPAPGRSRKPAEIASFDGVRLFLDRVRDARPGFSLDEGNAESVARICAELEGMPLAIELAAARAKILNPAQILERLSRKFELLTTSKRDTERRRRTLKATIEWSFDLLEDWERHAFMQACAFRGGFLLEAAEEALALPAGHLVVDALQSLCDKSLLRARDAGQDLRFDIYSVLREFGLEKWQEGSTPESREALGERLARHYISYGERWKQKLRTIHDREALDRLELETENLFSVQDWSLSCDRSEFAARAILTLVETLITRGPQEEILPRLERALAGAKELDLKLKSQLTNYLAQSLIWSGKIDRAKELVDAAVLEAERHGLRRERSHALILRGSIALRLSDFDQACSDSLEGERICREDQDFEWLCWASTIRSAVHAACDQYEEALACQSEFERISRERGDQRGLAESLLSRAQILQDRGESERSLACADEALKAAREAGAEAWIFGILQHQGIVLTDTGDIDGSLRAYDQAEALARDLGNREGVAFVLVRRAVALLERKDGADALKHLEESDRLLTESENLRLRGRSRMTRGIALDQIGEYEAALRAFDDAERDSMASNHQLGIATTRGFRAHTLLNLGKPIEARNCLKEILERMESLGVGRSSWTFRFREWLVRAERDSGRTDEALRLARETLQLAKQCGFSDAHGHRYAREAVRLLQRFVEPPNEMK